MSSLPLLRNSNVKLANKEMILKVLLHISSIFAEKEIDDYSTLSENNYSKLNLYVQPRFNTSCDLESLEAANECEARVLNFLIQK